MITHSFIILYRDTGLMGKLAQISMEYMMVVAFTLIMVIPMLAIYGMERQGINDSINTKQAENIARKIVDSAETVFFLGKPAKTTLKVYIPNNIDSVEINDYEVVFKVKIVAASGGFIINDIVGSSQVNMTGNITSDPGLHFIEIAADDNVVNITTKN